MFDHYGRRFFDVTHVSRHLGCHHLDLFKYLCDSANCGARFFIKEGLENHWEGHETGENLVPFKCEVCSGGFDGEVDFFKHLARQHEKFPLRKEYIIAHKQKESTLVVQLSEAKFNFEREVHVDVSFLAAEGIRKRICSSISSSKAQTIESSFSSAQRINTKRAVTMESLRPLHVMKAFSMTGVEKPIVFFIYNPHGFYIDTKRYDPPRHLRFDRLKAMIDEYKE